MAKSKGQQNALGIGQAEKQLNNQAQAAEEIQGLNEADQRVLAATHEESSSLNEVIEREIT
ncbi:hypothetical protein [Paenibacillus sedimenti]|uniref:Uncharacterized protein n=1 Tax=Paenibacillus sedimenti TaxID=2770274 RepID=A0A926QIH7_9BACL|nr:hypothetical protein [Paenibacillus sedimenti]MBD0380651.1 hypothetical protein [Paenibacillus sedimenti]